MAMLPVTLTIPACDNALLTVRLTASGVLADKALDLEILEDAKTAVYEACYAMIHQKERPAAVSVVFYTDNDLRAEVSAVGERTLTGEREPDLSLCRAVLETVMSLAQVQGENGRLDRITLSLQV